MKTDTEATHADPPSQVQQDVERTVLDLANKAEWIKFTVGRMPRLADRSKSPEKPDDEPPLEKGRPA